MNTMEYSCVEASHTPQNGCETVPYLLVCFLRNIVEHPLSYYYNINEDNRVLYANINTASKCRVTP